MKRTLLLSAITLTCLPLVLSSTGCDEASPVAPEGTVLSISVSPGQIPATGTATVRVTALRANGTPVNPGTQVRLATTLGEIEPIAEVGSDGVAQATLRGDGRVGTATVSARAGSSEEVTIEVPIGEFAQSITLQASPGQVAAGGRVDLLALVRDDEGRPLEGALVNFLTEVGTLNSGGALVATNAQGQARDVLRVSEEDIDSFSGVQFNVEAAVGGEGGALQRDTAIIRILALEPQPRYVARVGAGQFEVIFDNQSEGAEPLTFEWNFADGTTSTQESPVHDFGGPGTFQVRLTVTNAEGQESIACPITVPLTANVTCDPQ